MCKLDSIGNQDFFHSTHLSNLASWGILKQKKKLKKKLVVVKSGNPDPDPARSKEF